MFFIIPGQLLTMLTFPGVIVHEIAHRLFCDLAHVPVYKIRYYRVRSNPAGYVIHGPVDKLKDAFLIAIGPLIVNTVLCSILTFIPSFQILLGDHDFSPVLFILFWLGISIGMHAFPSNEDAKNLVEQIKQKKTKGFLLIISKFFSLIIRVAHSLRLIWIDAIYAILVSLFLPWLIGKI